MLDAECHTKWWLDISSLSWEEKIISYSLECPVSYQTLQQTCDPFRGTLCITQLLGLCNLLPWSLTVSCSLCVRLYDICGRQLVYDRVEGNRPALVDESGTVN